jgi:hypothetical protein
MEFRSLAENISFVHRASRVFQEPGAKQAKQRQMVLKEVAVPCAVWGHPHRTLQGEGRNWGFFLNVIKCKGSVSS